MLLYRVQYVLPVESHLLDAVVADGAVRVARLVHLAKGGGRRTRPLRISHRVWHRRVDDGQLERFKEL
jgi:hypothetical protein